LRRQTAAIIEPSVLEKEKKIPATQLKGPKGNGEMQEAKRD